MHFFWVYGQGGQALSGGPEPKATFSASFGPPFLLLHPMVYPDMVKFWRLWDSGGTGERIGLAHVRARLRVVLDGHLEASAVRQYRVSGLQAPTVCPDVPATILMPRDTW